MPMRIMSMEMLAGMAMHRCRTASMGLAVHIQQGYACLHVVYMYHYTHDIYMLHIYMTYI